MLAITPIVMPLTVVQERKEFHNVGTGAVHRRHVEAVPAHPCPVRDAVNTLPVELELLTNEPEHFPTTVLVNGRASVRTFQFHHLSNSAFGFSVRAA